MHPDGVCESFPALPPGSRKKAPKQQEEDESPLLHGHTPSAPERCPGCAASCEQIKGDLTPPPLSWSPPGSPPQLKKHQHKPDAPALPLQHAASHRVTYCSPRNGFGLIQSSGLGCWAHLFSKPKSGGCNRWSEDAPVSVDWQPRMTGSGYPEHGGWERQLGLPWVVSSQEDPVLPGGMAHLHPSSPAFYF